MSIVAWCEAYDIELANVACVGQHNPYHASLQIAHTIIFIHSLHISMHNLQRDQLVIRRVTSRDEEQRSISSIHNLWIYPQYQLVSIFLLLLPPYARPQACSAPLYSRKLHILVRLASTSCDTSLMIFAFSLGERVVNHFASLCCGRKVSDWELVCDVE